MFWIEIEFPAGSNHWAMLPGDFKTREDAHWACAQWRQKYGRPTGQGDPFRVIEAPSKQQAIAAEVREMAARGLYPV